MYKRKKGSGNPLTLVLAVLAIIFLLFPKTASAAVGEFTIDLSSSAPASGSTITASMSVDVDVNQLGGYDLTWKFDPAVLQISNVAGGTTDGYKSITDSSIDNTNGELHLVHFSTTYGTGVVNYALITFDVVGAADSTTTFTLTVTDLGDPDFNQIAEGTRGLVGPATVTVVDTTAPVTTATPAGGLYNSAQSVTLTANEAATIYYTIDGSEPTTESAVYSEPLAIAAATTLQFFAKDGAGNSEEVKTEVYTIDTDAPVTTATPAGGLYNSAQSVTLAANETATIYYTTDGSTPTTESTVYSAPIDIAATMTLKFFAVDTAGNSEEGKTEVYTIDTEAPVTTATPAGGLYNSAQSVTLTANEAATIYYTTDGSTPTTDSAVYSAPLAIAATTTLQFFAKDGAGNSEEVKTEVYTIDTEAPVTTATPAGGLYNSAQSVTLAANETATIYYTTDGSTPTTGSAVYSAPLDIAATTSLKFFAVDSAGNSEGVKTEVYTLDTEAPNTSITDNPAVLSNNSSASFSFTSTEEGSTFQCQLDGGNYADCTSPKEFTGLADGSHTFSVKATDPAGNTDASPASYTWTIDTIAPVTTATPAGGLYKSAQSVTLAANETATIYYTTDGSTPTTGSAVYSAPLEIAATTTLKFFAEDSVGNSEGVKTETYTIDTTQPTGSITINAGAEYATALAVQLTLDATDENGISQMQFSNDSTNWSEAEAYATTKAWTLSDGDGAKTVYVKFKDNAGNWSEVSSDAITLDATVPDTSITAQPTDPSDTTSASFEFTSPEEGATFQCQLDSEAYADCTSPKSYTGLAEGSHTFSVRAADAAGNVDATPVSYTWNITLKHLVSIQITAPKTTVIATRTVQLTATGTYDDVPASTADLTGTVTWNSTNPNVGSFIQPAGTFKGGLAAGTTEVSASANGINSNTITMTVNDLVTTSIELTATPQTGVVAGTTVTITATIKDAESTKIFVQNADEVSFSVISGGGTLGDKAVLHGDVLVVLTTGTIVGENIVQASSEPATPQPVSITTIAGEAHHLTISPATVNVKKGTSKTFAIQLQDANNNKVDITEEIMEQLTPELNPELGSLDEENATIVSGEIIVSYTAPADVQEETTVNFSVSMGVGVTDGVAVITLQPKALVSIAISEEQNRTTVKAGFSLQFNAVGTYDDPSTENLTERATWASSDETIAQMWFNGQLVGRKAGTVTITASAEGKTSNPLSITVTAATPMEITTKDNQKLSLGSSLEVSITGGGEWLFGSVARVRGETETFIQHLMFDKGKARLDLTRDLLRGPLGDNNYAGRYVIRVFDEILQTEKTITFFIPLDIVPKGGVFYLGVPIDFQAFGTTDALEWTNDDTAEIVVGTMTPDPADSSKMRLTTKGKGTFTVTATGTTDSDVTGTTNVISIIAGGMVDVTVTNAADADSAPIAGATVGVFGIADYTPETTDADGLAELRGLPSGRNLVILVSAEGFSSAKATKDVKGALIKASTDIATKVKVALTPSAIAVTGDVVDLSGNGVVSASVNLSGKLGDGTTAFSATTNASANGAFSFGLPEGASGGTFKLVASAPGYGNSAVVTLPSVTDDITDVELMLSIFMTSRENPTTRVTTVRIFDMSGQLDGTTTVDFVAGTDHDGELSAITQVGASSNLGVDTPSHLSFTYTPGVGDVEGQISVSISHADLPDRGETLGNSVDFSFIIHPVVQVGDKIPTATTRVDVDATAGGSIGIGTVDTDGDGIDDTQDNSEVMLPPNAIIDADGNAVAAITVRLSRTEGAAGAASAVYNVDIIDPLTGLEIPLRKVNIQQVPPEERIIIRIQIDPAIFDLAAFESGQLVVQYTDSAGDVFKNDGTFVATVEGNTIVIESSHASGWSVGAPDAATSEAGGGGSSGGCFIATATSGSPLQIAGQNLRDSGGSNLMSNGLSRWLVNQYHWYSRALADLMTQ